MGLLGEDRGARLNITNTTVRNSNFCKGAIVYRRVKTISYIEEPRILNFTA